MALDNGDQYTQLCNNGRHIDNRIWIIPATAYPISFYGLKLAALDLEHDPLARLVVSALVVLVFFGFLFQFARYLAYGFRNSEDIKKLEQDAPTLSPVIHLWGLEKDHVTGARCYVRLAGRWRSGGTMLLVMFLSWLVCVAILCKYFYRWCEAIELR